MIETLFTQCAAHPFVAVWLGLTVWVVAAAVSQFRPFNIAVLRSGDYKEK